MRRKFKRKAMTLTEILIAVVVMATAILPIIGLMSNSIRVTEQDENTQRAAKLCQEKLDIALQMPYDKIDVNTYNATINFTESAVATLTLGLENIEGTNFNSTLNVSYVSATFTVPICDFQLKAENNEQNPQNWGFQTKPFTINNRVKRFTVTVTWRDHGKTNDKVYTLSCLKADIR